MKQIFNQLRNYAELMRLHKPIGIYLLLWPTLWALLIAANGKPKFATLIIFVMGVVLMRSAGCIINDIFDRGFDGSVRRTAARPLVTGKVSLGEAILLFIFLCVLAGILVLQLNYFALTLSLVALLLTLIYPLMKRYIFMPQLVLGMAFAWSVPMAFAAELNYLPWVAWLLYVIAVCWPVAYDSIYALMDREDDIKIGVKSSAILFGSYDNYIITSIQIFVLVCLCILGFNLNFTIYYYLSLGLAFIFIIYQSWLISSRESKNFYKAFYNNHWLGLIIFAGISCHYLFTK